MTRHFLALAHRDGIDIDLQHLRLRPELAAAACVVGERAADRDDEVGLLQVLEADLGREAARDADAVWIVVEQPSRGKRRRQQSTGLRGQALGRRRPRRLRPHPGRRARQPARRRQAASRRSPRRRDAAASAKGAAATRARACGRSVRPVPGPVLQVERNADHHRPAFAARLQERVAYRHRHAFGHVQAVIGGARRVDDRRLIDAPGCTSRSSAALPRRTPPAADEHAPPPAAP